MAPDERDRLIAAWIAHYVGDEDQVSSWEADRFAFISEVLGVADAARELATLRDCDAWLLSPTAWAATKVTFEMYRGDESAWELLVELVRRVPEELLSWVAAGPLETFLTDDAAERFEARLDLLLRDDRRFRVALWTAQNPPEKAQALANKYSD
jgi:hypothetical protein